MGQASTIDAPFFATIRGRETARADLERVPSSACKADGRTGTHTTIKSRIEGEIGGGGG